MATKYTGDNYKPHIEGLWAPVRHASVEGELRPAMLFLGDCYVILFEFNPVKKTCTIDSYGYLLEDNQFILMSREPENEDLRILTWDVTDDHLLEFEEDGRRSVWEPVLAKELAEEGYPITFFESYRKAYADNGISHSIVGVAPPPSTMQAIKKLKGSQSNK